MHSASRLGEETGRAVSTGPVENGGGDRMAGRSPERLSAEPTDRW